MKKKMPGSFLSFKKKIKTLKLKKVIFDRNKELIKIPEFVSFVKGLNI